MPTKIHCLQKKSTSCSDGRQREVAWRHVVKSGRRKNRLARCPIIETPAALALYWTGQRATSLPSAEGCAGHLPLSRQLLLVVLMGWGCELGDR